MEQFFTYIPRGTLLVYNCNLANQSIVSLAFFLFYWHSNMHGYSNCICFTLVIRDVATRMCYWNTNHLTYWQETLPQALTKRW